MAGSLIYNFGCTLDWNSGKSPSSGCEQILQSQEVSYVVLTPKPNKEKLKKLYTKGSTKIEISFH